MRGFDMSKFIRHYTSADTDERDGTWSVYSEEYLDVYGEGEPIDGTQKFVAKAANERIAGLIRAMFDDAEKTRESLPVEEIPMEVVWVEFDITETTYYLGRVGIVKQQFEEYTGECFSEDSLKTYIQEFVSENDLDVEELYPDVQGQEWSEIHILD